MEMTLLTNLNPGRIVHPKNRRSPMAGDTPDPKEALQVMPWL
jgi:hypothetical protein